MSEHQYDYFFFFFFNDTATTEIYTLSLHDALPISKALLDRNGLGCACSLGLPRELHLPFDPAGAERFLNEAVELAAALQDRKSTRLNSSHANISYAVFCLKKKKK